jgi:hypothetical protein
MFVSFRELRFLLLRDLGWFCTGSFSVIPMGAMKRVVILSYLNDPNFGDRLGYHVLNSLLPPDVEVEHATARPWSVRLDRPIDLLIIGIGNSLNAATIRRQEFHDLIEFSTHRVGVFGLQYPEQYQKYVTPDQMTHLFDSLDHWFARYRRDLENFGTGRGTETHLGDLLISAFPLAQWRENKAITIPAEIKSKTVQLDRFIQRVQGARAINSYRIHPLLCGLTTAEKFKFHEQHEDPDNAISGKFNNMLSDIFGRDFEEDTWHDVDRDAVRNYKIMVDQNLAEMRVIIRDLLR